MVKAYYSQEQDLVDPYYNDVFGLQRSFEYQKKGLQDYVADEDPESNQDIDIFSGDASLDGSFDARYENTR
jgi:hypothetical protein